MLLHYVGSSILMTSQSVRGSNSNITKHGTDSTNTKMQHGQLVRRQEKGGKNECCMVMGSWLPATLCTVQAHLLSKKIKSPPKRSNLGRPAGGNITTAC